MEIQNVFYFKFIIKYFFTARKKSAKYRRGESICSLAPGSGSASKVFKIQNSTLNSYPLGHELNVYSDGRKCGHRNLIGDYVIRKNRGFRKGNKEDNITQRREFWDSLPRKGTVEKIGK